MRIECRPCFAVDALSAVAAGKRCRRSFPAVRKAVLAATNGLADRPDPWSLSTVLTGHLMLKEIERLTLPELAELVPNWMRESELLARYAEEVGGGLRALGRVNFPALYHEQCLPVLNEWAERLGESMHKLALDGLRADMDALCRTKAGESLRVYVSYFCYPNTFTLSDRVIVSSCRMGASIAPEPLLEKLVHELLHGTVPPQAQYEYDMLCTEDPFLARTRKTLSERMAGLQEEELVAGMGQYICASRGLIDDDAALRSLGQNADYSMPVATVLFDALRRYGRLPENMDAWLGEFMCELRQNGVRQSADCVSPGYSRCYERVCRREQPTPVRTMFL